MKLYRMKPRRVLAMQWDGTAEEAMPIIEWLLVNETSAFYNHDEPCIDIFPLGADRQRVHPGCYVASAVRGDFQVWAPEDFEDTYEAVEDS